MLAEKVLSVDGTFFLKKLPKSLDFDAALWCILSL